MEETINSTQKFYIRCIKPNNKKESDNFVEETVKQQLIYQGIKETVKIRKMGFPIRYKFENFLAEFKFLLQREEKKISVCQFSNKEQVLLLLNHCLVGNGKLSSEMWQLGNSKIFLKKEIFDFLVSQIHSNCFKQSVLIQKFVRMFLERKKFQKLKNSAFLIKKNLKNFVSNEKLKKRIIASFVVVKYLSIAKKIIMEEKIFKSSYLIVKNWRIYKQNKILKRRIKFCLAIVNFTEIHRQKIKKNEFLRRENEQKEKEKIINERERKMLLEMKKRKLEEKKLIQNISEKANSAKKEIEERKNKISFKNLDNLNINLFRHNFLQSSPTKPLPPLSSSSSLSNSSTDRISYLVSPRRVLSKKDSL